MRSLLGCDTLSSSASIANTASAYAPLTLAIHMRFTHNTSSPARHSDASIYAARICAIVRGAAHHGRGSRWLTLSACRCIRRSLASRYRGRHRDQGPCLHGHTGVLIGLLPTVGIVPVLLRRRNHDVYASSVDFQ